MLLKGTVIKSQEIVDELNLYKHIQIVRRKKVPTIKVMFTVT